MVRLMAGQQATIAPLIPRQSRFWRARQPVKAAHYITNALITHYFEGLLS